MSDLWARYNPVNERCGSLSRMCISLWCFCAIFGGTDSLIVWNWERRCRKYLSLEEVLWEHSTKEWATNCFTYVLKQEATTSAWSACMLGLEELGWKQLSTWVDQLCKPQCKQKRGRALYHCSLAVSLIQSRADFSSPLCTTIDPAVMSTKGQPTDAPQCAEQYTARRPVTTNFEPSMLTS